MVDDPEVHKRIARALAHIVREHGRTYLDEDAWERVYEVFGSKETPKVIQDKLLALALPWNETNPEWWKAQIQARHAQGENIVWEWLVNEWAARDSAK